MLWEFLILLYKIFESCSNTTGFLVMLKNCLSSLLLNTKCIKTNKQINKLFQQLSALKKMASHALWRAAWDVDLGTFVGFLWILESEMKQFTTGYGQRRHLKNKQNIEEAFFSKVTN